jgi:hypothetical protein
MNSPTAFEAVLYSPLSITHTPVPNDEALRDVAAQVGATKLAPYAVIQLQQPSEEAFESRPRTAISPPNASRPERRGVTISLEEEVSETLVITVPEQATDEQVTGRIARELRNNTILNPEARQREHNLNRRRLGLGVVSLFGVVALGLASDYEHIPDAAPNIAIGAAVLALTANEVHYARRRRQIPTLREGTKPPVRLVSHLKQGS